MQKVAVKFMVFSFMLLSSSVIMAGSPTPPPPPPGGAPIDAGAIILLVAGLGLAINKLYQNRQQAKLVPAKVLANK